VFFLIAQIAVGVRIKTRLVAGGYPV